MLSLARKRFPLLESRSTASLSNTLLLCVAAGLFESCGSEPRELVVAQVGDTAITASEFERFVDRLPTGLLSGKEGREADLEHLRSAVDQELMLLEARARGVDTSSTVRRELERLVRERLTGRYHSEVIAPRRKATQQEVERASIEKGFNRERLLSRIVVRRRDELDNVLRQLDGGVAFEALAEHYADNDLFADESGLVGWIGLSVAQRNFQIPRWVFSSLADGERAEPVRHPGAWQIYRFLDTRAAELEKYEKDIRRLLGQEKGHAAVVEDFELLSHRYDLRLHEEGLGVLLNQSGPLGELELSADDTDRMVYSFGGGEITVGDLVARLQDEGLGGIAFTDSAYLVETAESLLLHALVFSLAARERGWDQEPAFSEWYELKRVQVIVTNLTKMEAAGHASPSEEEVREYYLANEHRFVNQEKVYIREVVAGSEGEAEELRSEIERGVDIPELLRRDGVRTHGDHHTGEMQVIRLLRARHPQLVEAAFEAQEGDLIGPVKAHDGYAVFRLLRREGGELQPFEQVRRRVAGMLRQWRETELISALIKRLREKYEEEVVLYADRLGKEVVP